MCVCVCEGRGGEGRWLLLFINMFSFRKNFGGSLWFIVWEFVERNIYFVVKYVVVNYIW